MTIDTSQTHDDLESHLRALTQSDAGRSLVVDGTVVIRHREPDLPALLSESLWPSFPVLDGYREAPFHLRVIRDALEGISAPEHWPVTPTAAFLDGDPVLGVRYCDESAHSRYRWYTPDDLVVDRGNELILVSRREDIGVTVRRVLRNHMLYPRIQAGGFLPLHAAAIVAPGHGAVVFPGRSGAGKTSTSLPFVLYDGWPLLATDLVFVGTPAAPTALGTPENITLGLGTIANSPRLAELVPPPSPHPEQGDRRLWDIKAKLSFGLNAFSRRLGLDVATRAEVRMFAFPLIHPEIAQASIQPLAAPEVERRLLTNTTSPEYHGYTAMLQAFRADPREVVVHRTVGLARALAASVPGFQIAHDGSRRQQDELRELIINAL